MIVVGALALGVVCGWLARLVLRAASLPAAAFLGLAAAGCWLAVPGAWPAVLAGAVAGAAAHAAWRSHLAGRGVSADRAEGGSGDG